MSSRARRLAGTHDARPFAWGVEAEAFAGANGPEPPPPPPPPDPQPQQARLAALEREAFAKGYEQGERAGLQAGGARAEAMMHRLAQTLEELANLRREMIRQTERQMVQLALAIARRVVRREVALDGDLTLSMARLALDRLGDSTSVTVRLHPDDLAVIADGAERWDRPHVTVVADRDIGRGGCVVDSDFGSIDASVEAQFQELARALLADEGQADTGAAAHGR